MSDVRCPRCESVIIAEELARRMHVMAGSFAVCGTCRSVLLFDNEQHPWKVHVASAKERLELAELWRQTTHFAVAPEGTALCGAAGDVVTHDTEALVTCWDCRIKMPY